MTYLSLVIPKVNTPQYIEKDDRLIPQWAIAVIVIGVGGLLFIIVFGVSVVSIIQGLRVIMRSAEVEIMNDFPARQPTKRIEVKADHVRYLRRRGG